METWTRENATPRPHDDYYLGCILKIAAACLVILPEATQAVYLERLRKLSSQQIQTATSRTIEEWGKPSQMPPLAFILERCGSYQDVQQPATPSFRQLQDRSGVSSAEIAQWLEQGKEAQQEHIAKLHEDPQWRAMAQRLGAKV